MAGAHPRWDHLPMAATWTALEADRAFTRAERERRRRALIGRVRRACSALPVYDQAASRRRGGTARGGIREIPVAAICATVEPNRAREFDRGFRPTARARTRWQRVWMAEERGAVLPPISVVQVGKGYAIRDGHHRVSVARARGAATITASVAAA
jgi:hypothetical protein